MIKSFFKIAFRNLWRKRGFSAINIFGLAMGLAVFLLIILFVIDELSYDKYNENAHRIYRINTNLKIGGTVFYDRETPAPMAAAFIKDYPQIEKAVRLKEIGKTFVKKGDETLVEPASFFADESLFDVFTLPMIAGDPKTALKQPFSLVLTETIAKKYFNSTDIIGETLKIDNTDVYKITGVTKDMPAQAHLHFNLIRSMAGLGDSRDTHWSSMAYVTYIKVNPGITAMDIDKYLKQTAKKYAEPEFKGFMHMSFDDMAKNGDFVRFVCVPLTSIHLYSTLSQEQEPSGSITYVYMSVIIAILILLIACVNFMNLSTALAAGRAREIGMRKVLGSNRKALIYQFLTESVITAFVALGFALLIALLFLPYFNQLTGKNITLGLFSGIWQLPCLLIISMITGILAGLYPALVMSAFKPVNVLKGEIAAGFKGGWLRNTLVVFQFTTVIILIIGTLVIYNQLDYIQNRKLGYSRNQVLILQNTASLSIQAKTFKQDVLKLAGVEAGTITSFLPTNINTDVEGYGKDAALSPGNSISVSTWYVDEDYIPTLGMQIVKGRNFSPHFLTDSNAAIINETTAGILGYPNPLNKNIYRSTDKVWPYHVIGVVKDFNTGTLHDKIEPLVLRMGNDIGSMAFRINTKNIPVLVSQIQKLYHSADNDMAGQPFAYSFMDDEFNHLYQSEQNEGRKFTSFAVFAIMIACLGLFGLVTYAAEQRTKEIGIRKVLGASTVQIVILLSADFMKLVGFAAIIGFPIAWWFMHSWLQGFAYRTAISCWVFVVAALIAFIITLLTVCFRAIKAALMNPVKSLRAE